MVSELRPTEYCVHLSVKQNATLCTQVLKTEIHVQYTCHGSQLRAESGCQQGCFNITHHVIRIHTRPTICDTLLAVKSNPGRTQLPSLILFSRGKRPVERKPGPGDPPPLSKRRRGVSVYTFLFSANSCRRQEKGATRPPLAHAPLSSSHHTQAHLQPTCSPPAAHRLVLITPPPLSPRLASLPSFIALRLRACLAA